MTHPQMAVSKRSIKIKLPRTRIVLPHMSTIMYNYLTLTKHVNVAKKKEKKKKDKITKRYKTLLKTSTGLRKLKKLHTNGWDGL